jgi:hypothetical protein
MKRTILFLSLLALSGCTTPSVQARSFYTSRRDLASYIVDTPDPDKETKRAGQKIWVRWFTPSYNDKTTLNATIRFEDGTERKEQYPISSHAGDLSIEISPDECTATGGVLCYKIVLCQDSIPLATTRHKLWTEKVEIKET